MNPHDNPDAYDYLTLASRKSPGTIVPGSLNPKREEAWDEQKAEGSDGGPLVHKGAPPIKFSVSFQIWKDPSKNIDHFKGWSDWVDILKTSRDEQDQKAIEIYHPLLEAIKCSAVVVTGWTAPIPGGRGGISIATVDFKEWSSGKKTNTGKPGGTKSKSGTGTTGKQKDEKPDPNADKKRQLKALTEERRALG